MGFDLKAFAASVRVTDGVYGTELQKRGLPPGGCAEVLNVRCPELVEQVARGYVRAGCDVIQTNSLLANRFMLASHGESARAAELAEVAVRIARRAAAGTEVKVFGSFGPTGRVVMMEQVSEEDLFAAFAETAEALAWGGADAIVLETFNELAEARIALRAVRKVCDLPVVVSMTFSSGPGQNATMMGNKPADLAAMARAEGADAVGANCGLGPEHHVRVAQMLRAASDLPVWIKPNAGLPVVHRGRTTFPMGPQEFAAFVPALIQAGANFIGGCCGTTPAHLRAVRRAMDQYAGRAR